MLTVYFKHLQKNWLLGIIPPMIAAIFAPIVGLMWPDLKTRAATFIEMLKSPVYAAMLGQSLDLNVATWQGAVSLYVFVWAEMIILFITIFFPVRLISAEVDKKTLDVIFSYPISRWHYLMEKFAVYLTYNLLFPILIFLMIFISSLFLNEPCNYVILTYAGIGLYFQLFALGACSLFCAALFLESSKALSAAAFLILGQYIIGRIGEISPSVSILQNLSILHYLNVGAITKLGAFPVDQLVIVVSVGLVFLIGAAIVFQKRELAY